jgi:tetraacyldisaccharide 4'-kinase
VGIVCRGFKGRSSGITTVGINGHPQATPVEVGDEAVMLARAFSGVVLAGRDRVQAARLAYKNFGLNVLILDDGLQHRRLGRSLDLVLIHARQGIGNGWLLPAGPLREPLSAIRRTDIVILTKGQNLQDQNSQDQEPQNLPLSFDTHDKPCFSADLRPTTLIYPEREEWQALPILHLSGKKVMLVSGVADPSLFHRFVRETAAAIIDVREFPDHHVYTQRDWQTIASASQKCDLIVTTEKDSVKLEKFPFASGKLVALRVEMVVKEEEQLLTDIEHRLGDTK